MADPAPVFYILRRNRKRRAEGSQARADTAPNVVPTVVSIPSGSPPPTRVPMPSDTKHTTGGRTGGRNLAVNPKPAVSRVEKPPVITIKPYVSDTQHTTGSTPAVQPRPGFSSEDGVMGGTNGLARPIL